MVSWGRGEDTRAQKKSDDVEEIMRNSGMSRCLVLQVQNSISARANHISKLGSELGLYEFFCLGHMLGRAFKVVLAAESKRLNDIVSTRPGRICV